MRSSFSSTVCTASWEITSIKGKESLLRNGSDVHLGELFEFRPKINSQKVYGIFVSQTNASTLVSLNRFLHKLYISKLRACWAQWTRSADLCTDEEIHWQLLSFSVWWIAWQAAGITLNKSRVSCWFDLGYDYRGFILGLAIKRLTEITKQRGL